MNYKITNMSMVNNIDKVSLVTKQLARSPIVAVSHTDTLKTQLALAPDCQVSKAALPNWVHVYSNQPPDNTHTYAMCAIMYCVQSHNNNNYGRITK